MRPKVKICCILSLDEARMAIAAGASAVGLVSEMPSGPGVIDETLIREIAAAIPPGIESFLLTSRQSADEIIHQHQRCCTNTIQICDRLQKGSFEDLRDGLPGIHIVQVIHVTSDDAVDEALDVEPFVDAILLDSGNPGRPVKELGGTGRRHNWEISRRICLSVKKPVYLAGGLRADNVAEAMTFVGSFGLDVCSGVRTDGRLDANKLAAFFSEINRLSSPKNV